MDQVDVAAASVAARPAALDQPGRLEHVEVVGEQVRRHTDDVLELLRRPVRGGQLVDDRQTGRLTQRGVHRRPLLQPWIGDHAAVFHSAIAEAIIR